MKNSQQTVLFLFGGRSSEHEISLISIKGILDALDRSRFIPLLVGISKKGEWLLQEEKSYYTGAFAAQEIALNLSGKPVTLAPFCNKDHRGKILSGNTEYAFDVVFPILHGPYGEDGTLQGLLELMGIPFVGSGCQASSLCMDKYLTKLIVESHGIPVVDYVLIEELSDLEQSASKIKNLGYPLFVKPCRQGSSYGVTKVKHADELLKAVTYALQFDTKCLIEKAISGREIECAVLGHRSQHQVALPGEIVPNPSIGWYSFEAKYVLENGATVQIPAPLPNKAVEEVKTLSSRVFKALECNGLARIDFFLEATSHRFLLNEVNTLPGFTPISMYPKMWEASGIKYQELITQLIELALSPPLRGVHASSNPGA